MPSKKKYILVFDCGATNVRAVVLDDEGNIVKIQAYTNKTHPDPFYPEYRIWDINEIWVKMCRASKDILS